MFQIMVVEDDKKLLESYCSILKKNGYTPIPAINGADALFLLEHHYIDLIISDITMPEMNGFEMIKLLRETHYTLPILVITARDNLSDKCNAFSLGADDYMVKPADMNEMLWRITALLRRSRMNHTQYLKIGDTLLYYGTLTAITDIGKISLPQKEFQLLFKLLSSPNRIFTKKQLMEEIWGMDSETDFHTLEVHISRLRKHFQYNPDFKIITIRGLGYKAMVSSQL